MVSWMITHYVWGGLLAILFSIAFVTVMRRLLKTNTTLTRNARTGVSIGLLVLLVLGSWLLPSQMDAIATGVDAGMSRFDARVTAFEKKAELTASELRVVETTSVDRFTKLESRMSAVEGTVAGHTKQIGDLGAKLDENTAKLLEAINNLGGKVAAPVQLSPVAPVTAVPSQVSQPASTVLPQIPAQTRPVQISAQPAPQGNGLAAGVGTSIGEDLQASSDSEQLLELARRNRDYLVRKNGDFPSLRARVDNAARFAWPGTTSPGDN